MRSGAYPGLGGLWGPGPLGSLKGHKKKGKEKKRREEGKKGKKKKGKKGERVKIGKSTWREGRHSGVGCAPFFVEIGRLQLWGASGKKNAPKMCELSSIITFFSFTSQGAHPSQTPPVLMEILLVLNLGAQSHKKSCIRPSSISRGSMLEGNFRGTKLIGGGGEGIILQPGCQN